MPASRRAPTTSSENVNLSKETAKAIWLHAQRLDSLDIAASTFETVHDVVSHLGYVQIDTINVIERSHHHVLWSRLPDYKREDLVSAQTSDKSIFEYWTHALAYVPTESYRFSLPAMAQRREFPHRRFANVTDDDVRRLLERVAADGPISIRDIEDDVLVEKDHAWASRKPSRRVLSMAFYNGDLTISARTGMLKSYDLSARHFGWERTPDTPSESELNAYLLDRALKSQGLISLDSACYLDAKRKPAMLALINERVLAKKLVAVAVSADKTQFWATPDALERPARPYDGQARILSPFDPLIIQRKRLELMFEYVHLFEAYVPAPKRVLGYFALPVLYDGKIIAAIDIKADRRDKKLVINKWTRFGDEGTDQRSAVERALEIFAGFQFAA